MLRCGVAVTADALLGVVDVSDLVAFLEVLFAVLDLADLGVIALLAAFFLLVAATAAGALAAAVVVFETMLLGAPGVTRSVHCHILLLRAKDCPTLAVS